jgi:TrmH family RNA methyltransferase
MISAARLKYYRLLKHKKYRKIERKFLIEGINLCEAALRSGAEVEILLFSEEVFGQVEMVTLRKLAEARKIPVDLLPPREIKRLSEVVTPQGVVGVVKMPAPMEKAFWEARPEKVLILDQISEPGNMGTILRTAEWFGIPAVVCSSGSVDVYSGKVLRSTAGAFFYLRYLLQNVNLEPFLRRLKKAGYRLYAADTRAPRAYFQVLWETPFALVVGNERRGVTELVESFSPERVAIPGKGKSDSLNAAVAAAILLAHVCTERPGADRKE